jgi:hypothetical protein
MSKQHLRSSFGFVDTQETTENLYDLGLLRRPERSQRSQRAAALQAAQSGHPGKTIQLLNDDQRIGAALFRRKSLTEA